MALIQGKQIKVNLTGSFTGSFTGNLTGTSSFATSASFAVSSSRAVSSSFATTSSYVSSIAPNIINNVDNYILTATGGGSINGEPKLTLTPGLLGGDPTLTVNGRLVNSNSAAATGIYSHAEGRGTQAIGDYSHAEGRDTRVIGDFSHAEGETTQAIGDSSHAEGRGTQAIGDYSHAEGEDTVTGINSAFSSSIKDGLVTLDADYGDVVGNFIGSLLYIYDEEFDNEISRGAYTVDSVIFNGTETEIQLVNTDLNTTIAYVGSLEYLVQNRTFGGDSTIPGNKSHAEGAESLSIGDYSHAEGLRGRAIGGSSHAEGLETQAIGNASHAEGTYTQALGEGSHAEGNNTEAIGNYSHAEGTETQAIGKYSHAEGVNTQAIGEYSHAEGLGTIAQGDYQHVQGQYNITSSADSAFIVGNGTDGSNRSNLIFAAGNEVQITGSLNMLGSFILDPTEDPDPSGLNLDSTSLFQSSSNTSLGYDLYIRQNGNVVKWKWVEGLLETGLLYGGVVTYSGSNVFVSPGSGIIAEHNATTGSEIGPIVTYVAWNAITQSISNISTQQVTYLYIDNNGDLQQQSSRFTAQQYHDYIPLGAVGHFDYTQISAFGGAVQTAYDQGSQVSNFIDAFGPLKVSGYGLTGQPGSLRFSIGSGTSFIHGGFYENNPEFPSQISTNSQPTASIAYVYRSGSSVVFDTNGGNLYTEVKPTQYDRDGDGTLENVGNGNWSIQRVFSDPKTGVAYIYYGQERYTTLLNTLQYLPTDPFTEGDTFDFTTFIGYLVLRGNASDLTDTSNNSIINAGLFRGSGQGSGGGIPLSNLDDLTDVSITSPSNGEALIYNSGIWQNGIPTSSSYATSASFAVSSSFATSASNISPAITNDTADRILTSNGDGTLNGESLLTFDGTKLSVLYQAGDEGGEILLGKAATNTTLTGSGVTIDVWQNKLRFFEQGGDTRGYYLDITKGGAGVGTNLGKYTIKQTSASSDVTGTTSETQVLKVEIPANSLSLNEIMNMPLLIISKTGVLGTATIRVKISTSATMPSGTTDAIATYTLGATNQFGKIQRDFIIDNGTIKIYPLSNSAIDNTPSTSPILTRSFDPTIMNYLYISLQNSSSSDSSKLEGFSLSN